jgi:hypothetical protein
MWLLALGFVFLISTMSFAEQDFDPKYERDYNIFNLTNQYRPDNPLSPAQTYALNDPFNPMNRFDPGNPANQPAAHSNHP